MSEYIQRILDLLTPRERKQAVLVLGMVLLMAFIDTAGIASVMPFLAVLGNPQVVETNPYLSGAYDRLGFQDQRSFLLFLGVASFLVLLLCSLFRLATIYILRRYTNMRRHSVSERLLARYLRQPYEFFLGRNTADLSKTMLSEVDELAANVFAPAIQLIAYGATVIVVLVFLVFFDPGIALVIGGVIGGVYLLSYLFVKGILLRIGQDRVRVNRDRFVAASEVLGGIKDIKVLGGEDVFLQRFRRASAQFSRHQTTNAVLSMLPKYLVEAVGFGVVLGLAVTLTASGADMGAVLPTLGLYVVAGYRLLPASQQIFAALTQLRFGSGALDLVHADLSEADDASRGELAESGKRAGIAAPYRVRSDIRFSDVGYTYPGSDRATLHALNFTVPRNGSLGIVGETGAGKSTVLDLLLGLLSPSEGAVLVDGQPVGKLGVKHWQRTIGYVPQHIYLADASVAENIALGIPPQAIDQSMIEAASRAAQIHDFVRGLPDGYATMVGERGVRLSGGQRQRIGIARALYHDPDLLVLDEATNALDPRTEEQVMTAIRTLQGEKTLIIVAHRMSTVENCDQVMVLERGRIKGLAPYAELTGMNQLFRGIVAR